MPVLPFTAITVSGWIRWQQPKQHGGLVPSAVVSVASLDKFGGGSVCLLVMASGELQLSIGGVGGLRTQTNGVLKDGGWHHVAATWDGTLAVVYLDRHPQRGELKAPEQFDASGLVARAGAAPVGLATVKSAGGASQPVASFTGVIAQLSVWPGAALSASEIRLAAGSAPNAAGKPLALLPQLAHFDPAWRGGGCWLDGTASPTASMGNHDWSLAMWVRSGSGRDGVLLSRCMLNQDWAKGCRAVMVHSGALALDIGWQGRWAASKPLNDKQWHHVAITYTHKEQSLTLFIDGTTEPSWGHSVALEPEPHGFKLMIGGGPSGSLITEKHRFWDGQIESILLYTDRWTDHHVQHMRCWVQVAAVLGGCRTGRCCSLY